MIDNSDHKKQRIFYYGIFKSSYIRYRRRNYGAAFILIERWKQGKPDKITSVDQLTVSAELIIGVFQVIAAVFPGTSRSGATIVGALLIGVSRTVAAEFTFYLAVHVMPGASLLLGYVWLCTAGRSYW